MKKLRKSEMPANPGIILNGKKKNLKRAADLAMAAGGARIDDYHDDWCAILREPPETCNCKSTIVVRAFRPDEMANLSAGLYMNAGPWAGVTAQRFKP